MTTLDQLCKQFFTINYLKNLKGVPPYNWVQRLAFYIQRLDCKLKIAKGKPVPTKTWQAFKPPGRWCSRFLDIWHMQVASLSETAKVEFSCIHGHLICTQIWCVICHLQALDPLLDNFYSTHIAGIIIIICTVIWSSVCTIWQIVLY